MHTKQQNDNNIWITNFIDVIQMEQYKPNVNIKYARNFIYLW